MDSIQVSINSFNESRCRTCTEKTSLSFLHSLITEVDNVPSLSDMLSEVAKIDVKTENGDGFPKHVCDNCVYKLKIAYNFVLQAQQSKKYFEKQNLDCLQETPITLAENITCEPEPYDEFLNTDTHRKNRNIKVESIKINQSSECFRNLFESVVAVKDEMISDEENKTKDVCLTDPIMLVKSMDPPAPGLKMKDDVINSSKTLQKVVSLRKRKRKVEFSSNCSESKEVVESNNSENDTFNTEKDLPIIRNIRKRRCIAKKTKESNQPRFPCRICGETFAWKKSVLRHERNHSAQPEFCCEVCGRKFFRKDNLKEHLKKHLNPHQAKRLKHPEWNFASSLYSKNPFRLIQCKICDYQFFSTQLLHQHLLTHANIESLRFLTVESAIVKEFFTQTRSLCEVKSIVCKDIIRRHLYKYYLVLNEFGYEMSLSDSDIDTNDNKETPKYSCEICKELFVRKHQVFTHIKDVHANDELPYRCDICKVKFVCEKMFNLHTRSQCRCKEKKYKCVKCPGKFIWLENLKEHNCARKKGEEFICSICDEIFSKSNELTSHMVKHELNKKSFTCNICSEQFLTTTDLNQHNNQCHVVSVRKIRCCLCEKNFTRLSQLRSHLQQHADGSTGVKIAESHFFKVFYPDGCAGCESEVANIIAADLVAKNWSRYYITLDETYNELDLYDSESDTECLDNSLNQPLPTNIYVCTLCHQNFNRRKHILAHQNNVHSTDILPFNCSECNIKFVCNSLLQSHLVRDCLNPNKKYQCNDCGSRFVWEENLKLHLESRHTNLKVQSNDEIAQNLQCDICFKIFIWPRDLRRHKRDMHKRDDEKYECPYCDRKFNRKDNMNTHLKVHGIGVRTSSLNTKLIKVKDIDENLCKPNSPKIARCMICQFTHTKISELRLHLSTHQFCINFAQIQQPINEISELLYPEEFMSKETLVSRIMTDIAGHKFERFYSITNQVGYELNLTSSDTDDSPETLSTYIENFNRKFYSCDLCNSSFHRKYKLFEHQMSNHNWHDAQKVCDKCNARFVSEASLQQHYKDQCKNMLKHYQCRKCPRRFMWRDNLKAHIRSMHAIMNDAEIETQIGNTKSTAPEKKYLCELCGFASAKPSNLVIHLRRHTGEKPFSCDFCDKAFPNTSDLQCHRRSHTGEKPHVCTVCNKAFPRAYKLRVHMRIHSGERPYACTYCLKSFTHSKNLVVHERRHTGICPFKCGICGEGFPQGILLRRHRQKTGHHEDVVPKRKTLLLKKF
ncbi:zinc finger protein 585B-like [Teleopsis dalmanni]|uniref:zinc finger protein 585B-like n=1 Tax=Teleopsis dalmanni TaxID=139649 RepID=UPI0018CC893A|nr:zinc finger protein 585B-like [Teleopsis dalmanni]